MSANPFDIRYGITHSVLGPCIEVYDVRTGVAAQQMYYDPETPGDAAEVSEEMLELANTLWHAELTQQAPIVVTLNAPTPITDPMPNLTAYVTRPRLIWTWAGNAAALRRYLSEVA